METELTVNWGVDWAWGLLLIVMTVVFHAYCLGLLNKEVAAKLNDSRTFWRLPSGSIVLIGGAALSTSIFHGAECIAWAITYRLVGALSDNKSAVLYSLNAITSYGHASLHLEQRWQLMGALEALNGWILFGLTTAYLFTVMQKVWTRG
jgi:hypothetical protein